MVIWRLATLALAVTAVAVGAAAVQEREEDNELDRFMEQVLARRDENRIARRQYVFDDVERFTVTGYDGEVYSSFTREYVWYRRDGVFVRSPVRFDGVDASEDDWQRYEAEWLEAEARRARDAASETPCAPDDSAGSDFRARGRDFTLLRISVTELSHNPLYGTLEGLHSVKPSTNMSKDMRALNRPNPHECNGLTGI